MSEYKATPKQWDMLEEYSAPEYDCTILELRARVEILESANEARTAEIIRLTNALARQVPDKDKLLRDTLPDAPPADGLTERVMAAMACAELSSTWEPEARAAIREVAAWFDRIAACDGDYGYRAAALLRSEADCA